MQTFPVEFHAKFIICCSSSCTHLAPISSPTASFTGKSCLKNTIRKKKRKRCEKPLMPVSSIAEITVTSNNQAMILASLSALTSLFSVPGNTLHIESRLTALAPALRYL
ncbi:rsc complex subunit rsc9 [Ceratobasidium sp. AG-Ba]|nr:rsc complex subunit rsc9 [Ceratobasidium sp. AG-Ba]